MWDPQADPNPERSSPDDHRYVSGGGPGWREPGRRLVGGIASVGLTLLVAAGACGGDDDDGSDDTTTSSSADTQPRQTTTTRFTPEEQEVIDAYLAFWEMAVRLGQDPDPDDPEIQQRASGEALGNLVDGLTTLRAAKQVTQTGESYAHEVLSVEIDGDTALLEDCAVDDSQLVDAATGEPVRGDTVTELVQVTLIDRDDNWLVDGSERIDAWSGVAECQ